MSEHVRTIIEGSVATITLDAQHNRNALSKDLVGGIHAAIDEAERADVRAIVLRHEGPAFCSGADLKERSDGPPDSEPFATLMTRLMDTPRPTIAAVDGAVRAGGIGLMASCDLVVVNAATSFALTEVRIGVAAAMISVPILRRVPYARIASAFLTGEPFDTAEARSMGLVTHVTDDVQATVAAILGSIECSSVRAIAATKALLHRVPTLERDAAMREMTALSNELFAGPDAAEGMAAFRAKRLPSWHPEA
jgi:enoyl-CoA hydratase